MRAMRLARGALDWGALGCCAVFLSAVFFRVWCMGSVTKASSEACSCWGLAALLWQLLVLGCAGCSQSRAGGSAALGCLVQPLEGFVSWDQAAPHDARTRSAVILRDRGSGFLENTLIVKQERPAT
jgi:hypothetical protein